MRKGFIWLMILLVAAVTLIYSENMSQKTQAQLMLKILSMDRNFTRYGDPITIGVSSRVMLTQLNSLGSRKVRGRQVVAVKMDSPADVAGFKAIYAGKNWANQYRAVAKVAVSNNCLMFCETEDGIRSGGGAVSFRMVKGAARLVVHVKNATNQGADIQPGFLKNKGQVITL